MQHGRKATSRPMPPQGPPRPLDIHVVPPKMWQMVIPPHLQKETPFPPDIHCPSLTDPEERLQGDMIESGYRDPALPNEFGSHRQFFKNRLADLDDLRANVGNDIDRISWCIQARAHTTNINENYKRPESRTMSEPKRKEWMQEFVKDSCRTGSLDFIPHFKVDTLLKSLCENDVPLTKALWLIKIVFASRENRNLQDQKDDWAQACADFIKLQSSILYSKNPASIIQTSSQSQNDKQQLTNQPFFAPNTNATNPLLMAPRTSSPHIQNPSTNQNNNTHNSTSSNSALNQSGVFEFFPTLPTPQTNLTPTQLEAKSNLLYTIKLLNWTYRDGFVPLDTVINVFAPEIATCNVHVEILLLSILFQYLPDIVINMPALDKFKVITKSLYDQFSSQNLGSWFTNDQKADNMIDAHIKLFSLFLSTLKVLVTYLPDFLEPQYLDFLNFCISFSYLVDEDPIGQFKSNFNDEAIFTSPQQLNSYKNKENSLMFNSPNQTFNHGKNSPNLTVSSFVASPVFHHIFQQNLNCSKWLLSVEASFKDYLTHLISNQSKQTSCGQILCDNFCSSQTCEITHLDALDGWIHSFDVSMLFKSLLGIRTDEERIVLQNTNLIAKTLKLLCEWSISLDRSGSHRIYLVSSLMKRILMKNPALKPLIADLLISYIDSVKIDFKASNTSETSMNIDYSKDMNQFDAMKAPPMLKRLAMLIAELIRTGCFLHDRYMRHLISVGILHPNQPLNPIGYRHKMLLIHIPLFGDCKHDQNQRNLILQRYLPFALEGQAIDELESQVDRLIFESPFKPFGAAEAEEMSNFISNLTQHSLFLQCALGQYMVKKFKSIICTPESSHQLSETNLTKMLIQVFSVLEKIDDYRSIIETTHWLLQYICNSETHYALLPSIRQFLKTYKIIAFSIDSLLCSSLSALLAHSSRHYVPKQKVLQAGTKKLIILTSKKTSNDQESQISSGSHLSKFTQQICTPKSILITIVKKWGHLEIFKRWISEKKDEMICVKDEVSDTTTPSTKKPTIIMLSNDEEKSKIDELISQFMTLMDQIIESSNGGDPAPGSLEMVRNNLSSYSRNVISTYSSISQCFQIFLSHFSKKFGQQIQSPQIDQIQTLMSKELVHMIYDSVFSYLSPQTTSTESETNSTQNNSNSTFSHFPSSFHIKKIIIKSLLDMLKSPYVTESINEDSKKQNSNSDLNNLIDRYSSTNYRLLLNLLKSIWKYLNLMPSTTLGLVCKISDFAHQKIEQKSTWLALLCVDFLNHILEEYISTDQTKMMNTAKSVNVSSIKSLVSIISLVYRCNLDSNDSNQSMELDQPSESALQPSLDKNSNLILFLKELLKTIASRDIYAIFSSFNNPIQSYHLFKTIFSEPSSRTSNSIENCFPKSTQNISNFQDFTKSTSMLINNVLHRTNMWTLRDNWIEMQLLLDAANAIESFLMNSHPEPTSQSTPALQPSAQDFETKSSSTSQLKRDFASIFVFRLAFLQFEKPSSSLYMVSNPTTNSNTNHDIQDVLSDDAHSRTELSQALKSLLIQLDSSVLQAVLSFLFGLLDHDSSLDSNFITKSFISKCFLKVEHLIHSDASSSNNSNLSNDNNLSNIDDSTNSSINNNNRYIDLISDIPSHKVEERLSSLILSISSLCISSCHQIDQIIQSHLSFIESQVLPLLNDLSKWPQLRSQLFIRLTIIKWLIPSEFSGDTTAAIQSNHASLASTMDTLIIVLMKLMAAPIVQSVMIDGKDLWSLALQTFASLKSIQKQASTRRNLSDLYPTLTIPSHLRIRLESVMQSVARKDRPNYINNSTKMFLPKGIEPSRQIEEQPELQLLNAFGARKIPRRELTYANELFNSGRALAGNAPNQSFQQSKYTSQSHPSSNQYHQSGSQMSSGNPHVKPHSTGNAHHQQAMGNYQNHSMHQSASHNSHHTTERPHAKRQLENPEQYPPRAPPQQQPPLRR